MAQQSIFVFEYHRRRQARLWDKGEGRVMNADPSDPWRGQEVRFDRVSDRLVLVLVHDPEAFDQVSRTCDYPDAADLADEEFRRRLPDQVLVEPV